MHNNKKSPRIIVALDYSSIEEARALIAKLNPELCRLKIGKIMFTHYGPDFVRELIKQGYDIFLDLKFHDIPQTVAGACIAAAELGVWMMNVHLQGGHEMLRAAQQAIAKLPEKNRPLLIGVTVLTSLDENDLRMMGIQDDIKTCVRRMAKLAQDCGLDGVVCSAQEAKMLRDELNKDFLLITPGIQFKTDLANDQKRVLTPAEAFSAGADYLVIGRSITQAKNPLQILQNISAK